MAAKTKTSDNVTKSIFKVDTNLPAKMDDLASFILIGQEQLSSVKAGIRAMKRIDMAKDVLTQKLSEAQDMAEILLDAECKFGELSQKMETTVGIHGKSKTPDIKGKQEILKDMGLGHGNVSRYERMAKNPEILESEKKKARENNDIVNLTQVIKSIQKADRIKNNDEKIKKAAEYDIPTSVDLFLGDALNLNFIEDNSIDLLCTDPPYFILEDEEWDKFESLEGYLSFIESWLGNVVPKIKSTGRMYISFSHDYIFEIYNLFKEHCFYGFNFGNQIIWNYKNNVKPFNRRRYRITYEPILYLYGKDAEDLNFTEYNSAVSAVWELAVPQSNYEEGKYHPCQKPLELYRRIIQTGSKVGDKVLDTFAGSGTTGIVCEELKRNCILIEREEEYHKIIRGRINSFKK